MNPIAEAEFPRRAKRIEQQGVPKTIFKYMKDTGSTIFDLARRYLENEIPNKLKQNKTASVVAIGIPSQFTADDHRFEIDRSRRGIKNWEIRFATGGQLVAVKASDKDDLLTAIVVAMSLPEGYLKLVTKGGPGTVLLYEGAYEARDEENTPFDLFLATFDSSRLTVVIEYKGPIHTNLNDELKNTAQLYFIHNPQRVESNASNF